MPNIGAQFTWWESNPQDCLRRPPSPDTWLRWFWKPWIKKYSGPPAGKKAVRPELQIFSDLFVKRLCGRRSSVDQAPCERRDHLSKAIDWHLAPAASRPQIPEERPR